MKNIRNLLCLFGASLLFAFGAELFAGEQNPYDVKYNAKRLEDITEEVFRQVAAQRLAYQEKLKEFNSQQNQSNGNGGYDPMMGPMPGGPAPQTPAKPASPPPEYSLDRELIKLALQKKYPARLEDSMGPMPLVDTRSKIDLFDAYKNEVARQFEADRSKLVEQEIKDAEETYPLYKEGSTIEIRFAIGREKPRTYKGVFKRVGRFQITIGRHHLRIADLPELLQARVDKQLNEEAKRKYIAKHPLLNRLQAEIDDALAERVKQETEKQFIRNLPRGWVYVSGTWRMPEDLVDEIIEYRQAKVKADKEAAREAAYRAQQEAQNQENRGM